MKILLALTLAAALVPAAHAQRATASAREWRTKVLGNEHRLHDAPERDFDRTIGPQYVYVNGWWYTADRRWVYYQGAWVEPAQVPLPAPRTLTVKPAPAPEG